MIALPSTRVNLGPRRAASTAEADAHIIIARPPGANHSPVLVSDCPSP